MCRMDVNKIERQLVGPREMQISSSHIRICQSYVRIISNGLDSILGLVYVDLFRWSRWSPSCYANVPGSSAKDITTVRSFLSADFCFAKHRYHYDQKGRSKLSEIWWIYQHGSLQPRLGTRNLPGYPQLRISACVCHEEMTQIFYHHELIPTFWAWMNNRWW